jgi:Uma2 family endonuclease
MELVAETIAESQELSAYEIERNKPMPSKNHSIVQANLMFELKSLYRKQYTIMSEIDIIMPERPNTVPDVAIYPKLDINFFEDQIGMTEMPITTIEIISPSQSDYDIIKKINRYLNAGVQSCWLVNPMFQAIYVYHQIGKYQFFNSGMRLVDTATGIELTLDEVFAV